MSYTVDKDGTLHENCRLLFLVGNDLLSEGEVDPGSLPDLGYRRSGVAYICPHCGKPWAHAILIDSNGTQAPFEIESVACANHPSQWLVPGSLLSGYRNEHYMSLLSTRALKREFIVHHNWMKQLPEDN